MIKLRVILTIGWRCMYFTGRAAGDILKQAVLHNIKVQFRGKFKGGIVVIIILKLFGEFYGIAPAAVYRVLFDDLIIEQQLTHLLYREKLCAHEHQEYYADNFPHNQSNSRDKSN